MAAKKKRDYVQTGIDGLDSLLHEGIREGSTVLVSGGTGSGKTLLSLQMMAHHASKGKHCLYLSFEEREEKLTEYMEDFGWNPEELGDKMEIRRYMPPFEITTEGDSLFSKDQKNDIFINMEKVALKDGEEPDFVFIDSLSSLASAFYDREKSYRLYMEHLFRFLEGLGATTFMIVETEQLPEIFSPTGVEEFLADGVIVLYNIRQGNRRESAVEVLKMRGVSHEKKIVAMQITENGITVYPEQEVFGERI